MSALLAGCGSPTVEEYLDGPYYLFAADLASSTSLSYSNGDGVFLGQVPARVVAVGWDARHLIAQRRPPDDRARIEYFIVERLRDAAGADREARVHGPYDAQTFAARRVELGVDATLAFQRDRVGE